MHEGYTIKSVPLHTIIHTNFSNDSGPVLQSWWSIDEDSIDDYDLTGDKVEGKSRFSLQ